MDRSLFKNGGGDTTHLSDNVRVRGLEQLLYFSRQVSAHPFRTDTACGRREREGREGGERGRKGREGGE